MEMKVYSDPHVNSYADCSNVGNIVEDLRVNGDILEADNSIFNPLERTVDLHSAVVRNSSKTALSVGLGEDNSGDLTKLTTLKYSEQAPLEEIKINLFRIGFVVVLLLSAASVCTFLLLFLNLYPVVQSVFIVLSFVLFSFALSYELYENLSYRLRRREKIKTSLKLKRLIIAPLVNMVVMIGMSFWVNPHSFSKTILSTVGIILQFFVSLLAIREINVNTRYINGLMKGLYVEKSDLKALRNKFVICAPKSSTAQCLTALATRYKGLKFYQGSLTRKLQIMMSQLFMVTLLGFFLLEYGEYSYLTIPTLACLTNIFIIHLLSAWQITVFNDGIEKIESFHHIDTVLSIKLFGFAPRESLLISICISALLNILNVAKKLF